MLIHMAMLTCAMLLGMWFYRYDKHDKEPMRAVLTALGLGFIAMWAAGCVQDVVFAISPLSHNMVARATVVAIIEDGAKIVVVLCLARMVATHFNDPMDGIIYGTFAGLGAGIEESLLYLSLSPATAQTLAAEVIRLVAHALMGGLVGFAVGYGARPNGARQPRPDLMAAGLGLSLVFHIAWDAIAYQPKHTVGLRVALMVLLVMLVLVWGIMLTAAERQAKVTFGQPRGQPCPGG